MVLGGVCRACVHWMVCVMVCQTCAGVLARPCAVCWCDEFRGACLRVCVVVVIVVGVCLRLRACAAVVVWVLSVIVDCGGGGVHASVWA